jgi:hypothetical protein
MLATDTVGPFMSVRHRLMTRNLGRGYTRMMGKRLSADGMRGLASFGKWNTEFYLE